MDKLTIEERQNLPSDHPDFLTAAGMPWSDYGDYLDDIVAAGYAFDGVPVAGQAEILAKYVYVPGLPELIELNKRTGENQVEVALMEQAEDLAKEARNVETCVAMVDMIDPYDPLVVAYGEIASVQNLSDIILAAGASSVVVGYDAVASGTEPVTADEAEQMALGALGAPIALGLEQIIAAILPAAWAWLIPILVAGILVLVDYWLDEAGENDWAVYLGNRLIALSDKKLKGQNAPGAGWSRITQRPATEGGATGLGD